MICHALFTLRLKILLTAQMTVKITSIERESKNINSELTPACIIHVVFPVLSVFLTVTGPSVTILTHVGVDAFQSALNFAQLLIYEHVFCLFFQTDFFDFFY